MGILLDHQAAGQASCRRLCWGNSVAWRATTVALPAKVVD
jgi:hypothetical protein